MLTTGNVLLPFCNIDLGGGSGYLRDISPLKRIPLARKILLADDSVTAQNMGRKILADAGYEVITVNNGSAALKKIAEVKPDLIVLDVYMPGYSGLEVCQRLKEVQETSRIPILLTVGKLEPFKPEEAKRVRAEGYIVKPFEASELLSALAKLEDKIVPRGESSKPGRFARANAALDEGRYDKSVAIEEDSGWKNRIAFPSKKKDKAVEEDEGNEAAAYSPVNKDLRTVVEAKPASTPQEPTDAEDRVNLTALAPEGLPKDVTPEEIAALAAAAAQVKGKIADAAATEPAPASPPVASEKPQPEQHEGVKHEAQPAAESAMEAPVAEVVTFASEKVEEKTPAPKFDEAAAETSLPPHSIADAVASIAASESVAVSSHPVEHPADEPVTMAVAAGAGSAGSSSRWTAVSVALAAEEAAISLEHEMQKAYAAFAAAETAHSELVASVPQTQSAIEPTPVEAPAVVEEAAAEPVVAQEEAPAPEVSQAMSAVAHAATDAISAAVKELEAVAASYSDVHPQISSDPAPTASEAPQPVEAKADETPVVPASASEAIAKQEGSETLEEPRREEPKIEEPKLEERKVEEQKFEAQPLEEHKHEEATAEEAKTEELKSDVSENTPVATVETSGSHVSTDHAEPPAHTQPATGEDIAATTAAAWASWRRVRESGSPKSESAPQDAAAMAVAAGAERSPEEALTDSNPAEIANIVDSVLADLRPKIFEEISRKMKKK